jgi:hypothetical protein
MKKIFPILAILLLANIVTVNAQWQMLVPPPPDLTSTPLKQGDFITYKARLSFEGLNIAEILNTYTNNSIPPETIALINQYINTSMEIINKIELKITVQQRTNTSIILNIFFYYNDTLNYNMNTPAISLTNATWSNTIYPYVRPPNEQHTAIMAYVTPLVSELVQTLKTMFPTLNVESWFIVKTSEVSKYYAGDYRTVNRLEMSVPNIKQHVSEIISYQNITLTSEQQALFATIPEMNVELYVDWDKEFGIYLGQKLSVRFSTASWFAYRALEVYASNTNLWTWNTASQITNTFTSAVTGYGEDILTFAIEGAVFGNTESLMMFAVYLVVPMLILIAVFMVLYKKVIKKEKG